MLKTENIMRILAMDTSGPVASVALAERTDGAEKLIGGFRLQSGLTHSETLMPMLEQLFLLSRVEKETVDAVAVTSGPGSFTGLRIGVSAAKGLCFAWKIPLIAVPTLDAIAYQLAGSAGLICPMMDARRGQVYTAAYRFLPSAGTGTPGERSLGADRNGIGEPGNPGLAKTGAEQTPVTFRMEQLLSARAVSVEDLAMELNQLCERNVGGSLKDAHLPEGGASAQTGAEQRQVSPLILLGDGVPVYLDRITALLTVPFSAATFHRDRQSAEALAALAFSCLDEGKTVDAAAFTPEYLRPSQAERNQMANNAPS